MSMAIKAGTPPSWYEAALQVELKTFYTCFDLPNRDSAVKSILPLVDQPLSVNSACENNPAESEFNKAASPNSISGCVLKTCANQLDGIITDIFNIPLYYYSLIMQFGNYVKLASKSDALPMDLV